MTRQPSSRAWVSVPCENPSVAPCPRSLHVCAVRKDSLYIFGGYDGSNRINDFYEFNFKRKLWSVVLAIGSAPSPRDRHVSVVYNDSFYVFAGFDGSSRVNDFIEYNFLSQRWSNVVVSAGLPPTARHSHAAVVYDTNTWSIVAPIGRVPRPRYGLLVIENVTRKKQLTIAYMIRYRSSLVIRECGQYLQSEALHPLRVIAM
ncbi:hypothetical protein CCR75_000926 [Bremia lactucae]|uniref:Uncharacterized protein n=1 Tax=Bremia lactucae TaxID=4779 RepID=A0A976FLI2_BRELC|nr:hypothetical protein CCR75_000926 [Bremia lactucae]